MECEVIYMGHSAWCVKTKNHWLIFDYQKGIYAEEGLEKGLVNFSELRNQAVIFFASHAHHDHYSLDIAKNMSERSNCRYVLGGFETRFSGSITVWPHEEMEVNGVSIVSGASTDSGVCLLVRSGELTIFHSGDNADWGDDDTDVSYYDEIDRLAGRGSGVDIAFIPVCTYSGQRPASMTKGALYAIEKLNPRYVFPMHANGREHLYKEFEQDARHMMPGLSCQMISMEKEGDVFHL